MTIYSVVAEGDSISWASAGPLFKALGINSNVPPTTVEGRWGYTVCTTFAGRSIVAANLAVPGSQLPTLQARAATLDARVTANYTDSTTRGDASRARRQWVLCLMIGSNVSNANPTTFASDVGLYCQARAAAGWHVILGTLPSRTDGNIANFDTSYQQPFNSIIKAAGWASANSVSAIVDYAADAEIGAANAADNATYFADQVHPTSTGYDLMGSRLSSALEGVLATI